PTIAVPLFIVVLLTLFIDPERACASIAWCSGCWTFFGEDSSRAGAAARAALARRRRAPARRRARGGGSRASRTSPGRMSARRRAGRALVDADGDAQAARRGARPRGEGLTWGEPRPPRAPRLRRRRGCSRRRHEAAAGSGARVRTTERHAA